VFAIRFEHRVIARAEVYCPRKLGLDEVAMSHLDLIQVDVRCHAPAGDWAEPALAHHLLDAARVHDLLENLAESAPVSATRRRCEADEEYVARREQAEMIEYLAVGRGDGMVRFVDDDDREVLRS